MLAKSWCGNIHEIPVVHAATQRSIEVEIEKLATQALGLGALESLGQNDQPSQAMFVHFRFEQVVNLFEWQLSIMLGHATGFGHAHTDEHVALSVLTIAGFEEAAQKL